MLSTVAVRLARWTPRFIKNWVHHSRALDNASRKVFQNVVAASGEVVTIEEGPMAGAKLAVSEHVSHAHISGRYEIDTQVAIDKLIREGDVCYDLGASVGYLSLLMARKASKVFAFEPAPHAQKEIVRQMAANNLANVEVVPTPVSDTERTVEFSLTDNAYGSCITDAPTQWPTLKLTTTTLDDFVRTHQFPDFIKMDVEGEEGRVLEGARTILKEKRTTFCCELHSLQAAQHVESVLHEYGYNISNLDGSPFHIDHKIIAGELQVIALPG